MNNTKSIRVFTAFALVVGLVFSFLIPTWEIPDEASHLNMIGRSVGIESYADKVEDNISMEKGRLEFNYDEKVDMEEYKDSLTDKANEAKLSPKSVNLFIIKHLPSTVGIAIGSLLNLPTYWILQLGELFALIFYVFVCYFALKLLPFNHEVMMLIMLMPMSIQQAGSMSYDSTLIPLCFLLVSYSFYLKFTKDIIGLKEVSLFVLLWGLITYIKLPYMFFGLIVFIIPLEKINIDLKLFKINADFIRKVRIPVLIVAFVVCGIGVYTFRDNLWIQIIWGFVSEFKRGCYLFASTAREHSKFLMTSTVGNFGWLDTPMPFKLVILVFLVLAIVSIIGIKQNREKNEFKMSKWDVFVLVGSFCVLCIFVTLGLVNHTITVILFGAETTQIKYNIHEALYQIPYIGGLQGRYYLPFLPILFMGLPKIAYWDKKIIQISLFAMEILLYVYVIFSLVQRYWVV